MHCYVERPIIASTTDGDDEDEQQERDQVQACEQIVAVRDEPQIPRPKGLPSGPDDSGDLPPPPTPTPTPTPKPNQTKPNQTKPNQTKPNQDTTIAWTQEPRTKNRALRRSEIQAPRTKNP